MHLTGGHNLGSDSKYQPYCLSFVFHSGLFRCVYFHSDWYTVYFPELNAVQGKIAGFLIYFKVNTGQYHLWSGGDFSECKHQVIKSVSLLKKHRCFFYESLQLHEHDCMFDNFKRISRHFKGTETQIFRGSLPRTPLVSSRIRFRL